MLRLDDVADTVAHDVNGNIDAVWIAASDILRQNLYALIFLVGGKGLVQHLDQAWEI